MKYIALSVLLVLLYGFIDPAESDFFSVNINGKRIPVHACMDFNYAQFVSPGETDIAVDCREDVQTSMVSPVSKKINALVKGKRISFRLKEASYLVVQVNGKKLFLFAEGKETVKEQVRFLNILDYKVKATTFRSPGTWIQEAIDDAGKKNRPLLFPAGVYYTGALVIGSNTHIVLEEGAVLKALGSMNDFPRNKEINSGVFITIRDASNVRISGLGTIDGNGKALRDKFGDSARMRLLFIENSRGIRVERITLRDPAVWNTTIFKSKDIDLDHLKLLNNVELTNTDGFDPDASQSVNITNCFAYCGDDNVAIKITKNDTGLVTSDILVKGCVFLTRKSSLKVGTETRGAMISDITFEDNDVVLSDRGMALYCADGALLQNIRFINNRFEENYPDIKQRGMLFRIDRRTPKTRIGGIKKVLVKNCSFLGPFPQQSEMKGYDKDHLMDVAIENLTIAGQVVRNLKEAGITPSAFANVTFK
jgi:hypothetical protein